MALTPEEQAELQQLEMEEFQASRAGALTPEEVQEMKLLELEDARAKRDQDPWAQLAALRQFEGGAVKPAVELTYGIKSLFTDLTPEEQARLDWLQKNKTGWGNMGEFTGDLLMLGLPASKVAQVATKAPKFARALGIAGESALVGGYEGAKAPGEDETRLGNAMTGAVSTAAIGSALPIATTLYRAGAGGITPQARELLEAGVELTPGQAFKRGETLETALSKIPGFGQGARGLQDKAIEQWNRKILQDVAPEGAEITAAGREGFRQVQDAFTVAYDDAYSTVKPDNLNWRKLATDWETARASVNLLPSFNQGQAQQILSEIGTDMSSFVQTGDYRLIQNLTSRLKGMADPRDQQMVQFTNGLANSLNDALPDNASEKLRSINRQYAKYAVAERAGSYVKAQENNAVFSPRNLESAVKAKGSGRQTVTGRAPLQPQADQATQTIAKVLPERSQIDMGKALGAFGTAGALLYDPFSTGAATIAGRGLATEPMRRLMLGEPAFNKQSLMAELLRAGALSAGAQERSKMNIDASTVRAMLGGIADGFEEHERTGTTLTLEMVAHSLPSMFLQSLDLHHCTTRDEVLAREVITAQLLAGAERLNRIGEPVRLN